MDGYHRDRWVFFSLRKTEVLDESNASQIQCEEVIWGILLNRFWGPARDFDSVGVEQGHAFAFLIFPGDAGAAGPRMAHWVVTCLKGKSDIRMSAPKFHHRNLLALWSQDANSLKASDSSPVKWQ